MPLPDHVVRDPRIKRTRQLLRNALRTLLREKPLDEILVHDITVAATVNRATFYDHYRDKFDLFNALVAADFRKVLEQRNICLDDSCSSGLAGIALAVGDYLQRLHRDQAACTLHAPFGAMIDSAVSMAIRRIVLDGLEKRGAELPAQCEIVASMVSGAIYAAVKESLSRTKWRADEAALSQIAQLIHPLLGDTFTASPRKSSARKRHPR